MPDYFVPAREHRIQINVKNSRFIASIAPVATVEEAKAFVDRIRNEFSDASHNVPVFIVGHGASVVEHCGDDGEPSGTAGRPAFAVLKGSDLGDVAVVITRYFGGTKLGTGGLVQAYSNAMREVLAATPTSEKTELARYAMTLPYAAFDPLKQLVDELKGTTADEEFAADITLTVQVKARDAVHFENAVTHRWPTSMQWHRID